MLKSKLIGHKSAECDGKKTMRQEKLKLELHSLGYFLGKSIVRGFHLQSASLFVQQGRRI